MASEHTLKLTERFGKPVYIAALDSSKAQFREVGLYAWKGEQGNPVYVGTHYLALSNVKSLGFSNGLTQLAKYLETAASEGYVPQIYAPPYHAIKKASQAAARGEVQPCFRPLKLEEILALRRVQNLPELKIKIAA